MSEKNRRRHADPPDQGDGPKEDTAERWRARTRPALEEIRRLIRDADLSQKKVESRAGFSRGYLSQLLAANLDLKVWHILAILEVVGCSPGEFFHRVYDGRHSDGKRPGGRRFPALDHFQRSSRRLSEETDEILGRLYGSGVESLNELRERLSRCEQAVFELEKAGGLGKRRFGSRGEES